MASSWSQSNALSFSTSPLSIIDDNHNSGIRTSSEANLESNNMQDDMNIERFYVEDSLAYKCNSSDNANNNDGINDGDCSNSIEFERRRRRLALDSVERDAERVWTTLPDNYRQEKDFVLAALKSPSLPSKSDFERRFPQSLRFDRDVVISFCTRPDFSTLYYSRHLFVPDCLTGDKEVMLAYCSKIPRSLQECKEELCNDREVVEAAIALDGLELQYASMRLQEEKELVVAACNKDGRALEFCPPGKVRTELTSDREFMLSVLSKHGGSMLRLVPDPLKRDKQLLLEALAHGMRFRYVPAEFQTEKDFLRHALERNSALYLEMNKSLQMDNDLASAAVIAKDSQPEIHKRALENCPQLESSRQIILAIAERGDRDMLENLLGKPGAARFQHDKQVMMAAIKRDCKLFKYAQATLREDPEVVLASIQEDSVQDTLREIPSETRRRYPEITIKAIQVSSQWRLRHVKAMIPDSHWSNRQVVLAWIRRGGPVLESFERTIESDQELALEVAQHNWMEFKKVGENLRRNRNFMMQAVQKDGRVLRFASAEIQNDFQVLVRAVANHHRALMNAKVQEEYCRTRVKQALDLHLTFVNDFLRGIAIATPHLAPARRSQLPMLDRGVETSQAFKKLIADYLGVPTGAELRMMRQAWNNLTYPPSHNKNNVSDNSNSDREEVMEDELMNLMGRRRERMFNFARRHHQDLGGWFDADMVDREMERMDRFHRAAIRDRLRAAHQIHNRDVAAAAAGAAEDVLGEAIRFGQNFPLVREQFFALFEDRLDWDEEL